MKKVLLLLLKGTEVFEAAAFYDVLGWIWNADPDPRPMV